MHPAQPAKSLRHHLERAHHHLREHHKHTHKRAEEIADERDRERQSAPGVAAQQATGPAASGGVLPPGG